MIKIIDLYWERVNLYLVFEEKIKEDIFLECNNQKIKLESYDNKIKINITNTPEGQMLEPGAWNITSKEKIVLNDELIKKMDDISRNFYYRDGKYAYLVDVVMNEDKTFYIKTNFMMNNNKWKKFYRLNEGDNIIDKIKIALKSFYIFLINFYYHIIRIFKLNKKKNILFMTENNSELVGNLKTLYDAIDNESCNKLISSFDNYHGGKNIFNYFKEITLIARSDVIFVDNYTPKFTHLKLSKKVKLVQLWHAGVGFKSVGYARFGLSGSPHPYVSCHRNYTDAIVDQEKLIPIYQEVFGVKKDIFKALGMPRLDGYLKKEKIEEETKELFRENSKFETHKVILFSPTYRGNGSRDAYYDYSLIDLDKVYKFCKKNNFIFVIKMHPFIDKSIEIDSKYQDLIFDYSSFDINKLIYVSDIMITDYSSCCYEYSLFDRPLIFYRFDKEIYEYLRPMHTVNAFTNKQDEVRTFDELMDCLDKYKNINIKDRFKNVSDIDNNSCSEIKKIFIGE